MARSVQTPVVLVAMCIFFLYHHPTFALLPSTNTVQLSEQDNKFFAKKKESILSFGLKTSLIATKRVIYGDWSLGGEIAIGPVIAWHPLNGIGFQTGLFYSYNQFFTMSLSIDRNMLKDRNVISFVRRFIKDIEDLSSNGQGYIIHSTFDIISFHTISFPCLFQLYPEKSQRLVCYVGPRFLVTLWTPKRQKFCPAHVDTSTIKSVLLNALDQAQQLGSDSSDIVYDVTNIGDETINKIYNSVFNLNLDPNLFHKQFLNHQKFYWDVIWDFGFEFKAKSGLVIGMNCLGIVLGYDYVK